VKDKDGETETEVGEGWGGNLDVGQGDSDNNNILNNNILNNNLGDGNSDGDGKQQQDGAEGHDDAVGGKGEGQQQGVEGNDANVGNGNNNGGKGKVTGTDKGGKDGGAGEEGKEELERLKEEAREAKEELEREKERQEEEKVMELAKERVELKRQEEARLRAEEEARKAKEEAEKGKDELAKREKEKQGEEEEVKLREANALVVVVRDGARAIEELVKKLNKEVQVKKDEVIAMLEATVREATKSVTCLELTANGMEAVMKVEREVTDRRMHEMPQVVMELSELTARLVPFVVRMMRKVSPEQVGTGARAEVAERATWRRVVSKTKAKNDEEKVAERNRLIMEMMDGGSMEMKAQMAEAERVAMEETLKVGTVADEEIKWEMLAPAALVEARWRARATAINGAEAARVARGGKPAPAKMEFWPMDGLETEEAEKYGASDWAALTKATWNKKGKRYDDEMSEAVRKTVIVATTKMTELAEARAKRTLILKAVNFAIDIKRTMDPKRKLMLEAWMAETVGPLAAAATAELVKSQIVSMFEMGMVEAEETIEKMIVASKTV
jgi:hypothetical protein